MVILTLNNPNADYALLGRAQRTVGSMQIAVFGAPCEKSARNAADSLAVTRLAAVDARGAGDSSSRLG